MTLRIEDGGRVYEFVVPATYKKKELVILQCLLHCLRQLMTLRKRIAYREKRLLLSLTEEARLHQTKYINKS